MSEQSDTPRMSIKFSGELGMSLLNRIAQLERERKANATLQSQLATARERADSNYDEWRRCQDYRIEERESIATLQSHLATVCAVAQRVVDTVITVHVPAELVEHPTEIDSSQ